MAARRIRCLVPYCRRSRRDAGDGVQVAGVWWPFDVWICQGHWAAVPARLRRLVAAARRRVRRTHAVRDAETLAWLYRRAKRAAVEAAGGLR